MNKWLVINLGDAMLAFQQQDNLNSLLLKVYEEAGSPINMAAYIRHESAGRLHCEVKIYLSPALASAVDIEGAQVCAKPLPHDLGLLVGVAASRLVLFPESSQLCSR
jgi:hypothetical protein